nr:MAG TPA: hypothetical protein [Caudoviricetes sp.]
MHGYSVFPVTIPYHGWGRVKCCNHACLRRLWITFDAKLICRRTG